MLQCSIIMRHHATMCSASKLGIAPEQWRYPVKNLILAAVAALTLTAAIAPAVFAASTVADDAQATRMQQTGSYSR
jgi:hypothetical protein